MLERAGYLFEVMAADIDEKAIRSDDFEELPLLLARAKAEVLLKKIEEPAILITSDQVVVYNGELREKPSDEFMAREYLASYGDSSVRTNTAVVVVNTETGKRAEGLDVANVSLKSIPNNIIEELIHEGKVLHAAGGIIIEHPSMKPFIEILEGSTDSVTGLPLELTEKLIEEVQKKPILQ